MHPLWLRIAAIIGFFSVGAGAFGAHALRSRLSEEMLTIFETGTRYAFFHVAALMAVAWLAESGAADSRSHLPVQVAGIAFTAGVIVFTGSLWLLALSGHRWLGAVTPLGGVSLLVGWLALAWTTFSSNGS